VQNEELVAFQELHLVVNEEEGPESGSTRESETGAAIRVAMTADRVRFENLYIDAINARLP